VRNFKLTLQYDGTHFHGWQKQPNVRTVSGVLECAIEKLSKERVKLIGASRTDKGVHAYGQVANFHSRCKIPLEKFPLALNSLLPHDLVVKDVECVRDDFHARFSAISRHYRYVILNHRERSPFQSNYSLWIPYSLDFERMMEGAKYLIGCHDFTAFSSSLSEDRNPYRTIKSISLKKEGECINLDVVSDSFLPGMIRRIAGTLIRVGCGKIQPGGVYEILTSRDRSLAGPAVQPHGLYLVEVEYP
jgi:tRNA pseudouridine38-40 synthase